MTNNAHPQPRSSNRFVRIADLMFSVMTFLAVVLVAAFLGLSQKNAWDWSPTVTVQEPAPAQTQPSQEAQRGR